MSELETFVLDYVEDAGGIVEPAGYDVHDVLLPDPVAERLGVSPLLKIAFSDGENEEAVRLGYNHPLVERMVEEVHNRAASTRLYVNALRLEKSGVEEAALKNWVVVNARVLPRERATVARVRSTYVRFNFKAAILSHEKEERLVSVLMDAHAGHRVAEAEAIEVQATATEPDRTLASLRDAPVRWRPRGESPLQDPLQERALRALLQQAKTAVLQEMSAELSELQKRVDRFHELDRARLTEYYDELERDLKGRLQRASQKRRPGLEDKLTAVQAERRHKLADLSKRYQVRLNLTLLNLLVIQHPKLTAPVRIENRSTAIQTSAVWDPLRHRLEPMVCGVCGQPVNRAFLCHNGHLAHEDCLAPACIDCKRVFCRRCEDEVDECDVCHRPLCRHSRIVCDECGRGTCREHVELCHANDGQPVDLSEGKESESEPSPEPQVKTGRAHSTRSRSRQSSSRPSRRSSTYPPLPDDVPRPQRIEIVLHPDAVAAFVLSANDEQIAVRVWELRPAEGGIIRSCDCEKGEACRADGMVLRPSEQISVEKQLMNEITELRKEYRVLPKQLKFNHPGDFGGMFTRVPQFKLFGLWKDEDALQKARQQFADLYWR